MPPKDSATAIVVRWTATLWRGGDRHRRPCALKTGNESLRVRAGYCRGPRPFAESIVGPTNGPRAWRANQFCVKSRTTRDGT